MIPAKSRQKRYQADGDLVLTEELKHVIKESANYSLEHPWDTVANKSIYAYNLQKRNTRESVPFCISSKFLLIESHGHLYGYGNSLAYHEAHTYTDQTITYCLPSRVYLISISFAYLSFR